MIFSSYPTALKIVSSKVILAVRIDSYQNGFDCSEGMKLKRDLEDKLEKIQEPSKCKTKKALPIPEEKKRSKRGGKRVKKMKERYAVTDLQSQQNKMSFSAVDGEYGDSAMGVDKGMVGSKDSGRLRAPMKKESKVGLSKKQKIAVRTYINDILI
jgi:U4/U6 small nuclear ribonucleoprotein PRP31